jgi:hypothetical protein
MKCAHLLELTDLAAWPAALRVLEVEYVAADGPLSTRPQRSERALARHVAVTLSDLQRLAAARDGGTGVRQVTQPVYGAETPTAGGAFAAR